MNMLAQDETIYENGVCARCKASALIEGNATFCGSCERTVVSIYRYGGHPPADCCQQIVTVAATVDAEGYTEYPDGRRIVHPRVSCDGDLWR